MKIELSEEELEFLIRVLRNNYGENETDFNEDIFSNGINDLLLGKLISGSRCGIEYFNTTRTHRLLDTSLNQFIFWGNGWKSKVLGNKLHKRLAYAFNVQSGMQQNGGMGASFNEESDKKDKISLYLVIKDIMTALGVTLEEFELYFKVAAFE